MKKLTLLILLLSIQLAVMAYPLKITSWQIDTDVKKLNELNISVDYVNRDTQTIIAYVPDDADYQKILSHGFMAEPMPDQAKAYADSLWEATHNSRDPMRAYYTWSEFITFMQNTATQYPDICQLIQFGSSVQNRPLYFMKISDNVTIQENEPEFRWVSSMHGDEVVGYDLLIRLIQLLTTQYPANTRIADIVNNTELWICPMLNPDGYVAHSRYNANGADLNRNFPLPIGSEHPDGMAWQPETIAVMNHGNEQSINLSSNYHGGALVANYPWDYIYPLTPDNAWFVQAALTYSTHNTEMYNSTQFPQGITNGAQWYIAEGTLQDWVYANNACMDLTVEVSNIKWPASTTLDSYWNLNQESILSFIEFIQQGVHGTVTNTSGEPLLATIDLNSTGIDIRTDPQVGDYHRMLLPGNYTLTVYAEGYQTASADVVVSAAAPAIQNFVLEPIQYTQYGGTVIDQAGNAISAANVRLYYGSSSYETQTSSLGEFEFTSIPAGYYILSISTAGNQGFYSEHFVIGADSGRQIIVLSQPLFLDDFSNGLTQWTVQSPWAVITQNSNQVLADSPSGNYSNNVTLSAALSSPVSLLNAYEAYLSFDLKYNLESGYDYLYVNASADGVTWTSLAIYTGVATTWQNFIFPLQAFEGGNLYLQFKLTSDNMVTADGVFIDNVIIRGLRTDQTVYGDSDSNWLIDCSDAENAFAYSYGDNLISGIDPSPWESFRLQSVDVDNDSLVTATDALYIYDRIEQFASFPVQSGPEIEFSDPGLSLIYSPDQVLGFTLSNPSHLKALTLNFSSPDSLAFTGLVWAPNDPDIMYNLEADNCTVSLLCLNDQFPPSDFLTLNAVTSSQFLHCSGTVNDQPVDMDIMMTGLGEEQPPMQATALLGAYPNPFSGLTRMRYYLSKAETSVTLKVFNPRGQLVRTLVDGLQNKGMHAAVFDGRNEQGKLLANGIYYCLLATPGKTCTAKLLILR